MILSIHIPKTSGLSIRNLLKQHYGAGFVLAGGIPADVPAMARCIHGHFAAASLMARFPTARLITWVRDPVDRVISSYYHGPGESNGAHPDGGAERFQGLPLLEFAALPQQRNEMTRCFGRMRPSDFAFIGIVERPDRSLARLRTFLGGGLAPWADAGSESEPLTPRYAVDSGTRAAIAGLNHPDIEWYRECVERDDRAPANSPSLSPWAGSWREATGT
ncbi:MAG TPA: hypothetical protein VGM73_11815 [Candidatus Didemnitutus sp.]|jgi:hypothetical protein